MGSLWVYQTPPKMAPPQACKCLSLVAPPLRLSLLLRPCRTLRMYAACPCPHAIQLPEVANPRQRQVLSPLHQRAVLRPRGYDKRSRGTVGSCVRALARKSYRSLIASDDCASRLGQPSPDGSLEARERTMSRSMTRRTVTLAQAMLEAPSTGTDAGTHSSWSTFLAFATSTIFTTSIRRLEHGAAYDHTEEKRCKFIRVAIGGSEYKRRLGIE
jgi:hypothetical protein